MTRLEVTVADHLGPCQTECGDVVRAGTECSTCLEEDGLVVHDGCCRWNGTDAHAAARRDGRAAL